MVDGELGVYRKSKTKGIADERQEVGPAVELVENPTGIEDPSGDGDQVILTKEDWIQQIAGRAMLGKSAGCLIVYGSLSNKPVKLIPLPRGCLRALRPMTDPWTIIGWQASLGGMFFYLRPKEAIRFTFAPDLDDPLEGVGPGIPAQTAVDTRESALRYNKHALENGGSLGGILQFEEDLPLDDDQVKEVRRRFEERHMGMTNAERLAILTGKFKWIETGKSAKDMQYATTIDKSLEDIARPFGAPLLFLGVSDHSALSKATVLVEKALLYHGTVIPFSRRFAAVMTRIVRRFDPNLYCWWDFSKVEALKDDESDRIQRAKELKALGFTLAAIEEQFEFGLKLPDHADVEMVSASTIPLDLAIKGAAAGRAQMTEAVAIVTAVANGQMPRDSGIGLLTTMFGMTPQEAETIIGSAGTGEATDPNPDPAAPTGKVPAVEVAQPAALLTGPDATARSFTRAQIDVRTRAWNAYVRKVQPKENAIAGAYRKNLNAQRATVLAKLKKTRAFTRDDVSGDDEAIATDVSDSFDVDGFIDDLSTSIQNAYLAGSSQAGSELSDLGLANDVLLEADKGRLPKLAQAYWDGRQGKTILTGERIKTEIHDTILEGLTNSEGAEDLATRVRDVFKGNLKESSVRRIARTEAHTAVGNGRVELMKSQGVKKGEWVSARDTHVRDSHQAVDGEVRELGEPFSNGLLWPGDPAGPADETIACRCLLVPVADGMDDFADDTERAAHLDLPEIDLCVFHPSFELARRAIHLGIASPVRAVAKGVARVLAVEAKRRDPDSTAHELLRDNFPMVKTNPAFAGAVRELGATLFASIWTEAFESDLKAA